MLRKLALDWSPLRTSPSFRRLWLAQTVSFIGSEVGYVALTYQVYQLTGSTLAVGLLSLAQLVPLLTLTIVGGAFADVRIASAGLVTAYALVTATFFGTLIVVWLLPPLVPQGGEDARPSLRTIVDGFHFAWNNKVILGFMLVDTNAMIFGMPIALF